MLKLVHDKFNEDGVQVKNAKGTVWATKGDGHLAGAPETKAQAEAATKSARDKVQETVKDGEAKNPYEALDYVPDVAKTPGKGWRPIEEAATDPRVFDPVWKETMIAPGTSSSSSSRATSASSPACSAPRPSCWCSRRSRASSARRAST